MLTEQPAECRQPRLSLGEPVRPFGQLFREPREAPRREVGRILDRADHLEITASRQ